MAFTISPTQPFTFHQVDTTKADACWIIKKGNHQPYPSYSLWWDALPTIKGQKIGYIGNFENINNFNIAPLLEHGCDYLRKQGCTMAIAPIDGQTWQRYRVVTETDDSPPFFLESPYTNINPIVFTQQGFQVMASYHSRRVSNLLTSDRRSPQIRARLTNLGVKIRPIRLDVIEKELEQLHAVVHQSFQSHFLYKPTPKEDFIQQYLKLKDFIVPELVLIAEHNDRIVGFMFAVLDFANTRVYSKKQTVIFKTLGILPQVKYAGLGILLLDEVKKFSVQLGINEAIYAFIQSNQSCDNMTRNHGEIFRRYAVFGKNL